MRVTCRKIIKLDWNSKFESSLESSARVVHSEETEENAESYDGDVVHHNEPEEVRNQIL